MYRRDERVNIATDFNFAHIDESGTIGTPDSPIISTLQHPHRTAVSWLSRDLDINVLLLRWNYFIEYCDTNQVILFNLNCPVEKRKNHLVSILKRADIYKDEHEEIAEVYAKKWKLIGSKNSRYKDAYVSDETLPNWDWNKFEHAVRWYEAKAEECA
jgi:hypothetical protein